MMGLGKSELARASGSRLQLGLNEGCDARPEGGDWHWDIRESPGQTGGLCRLSHHDWGAAVWVGHDKRKTPPLACSIQVTPFAFLGLMLLMGAVVPFPSRSNAVLTYGACC